jgi:hypothetical protein
LSQKGGGGAWWLIILATQEAETERMLFEPSLGKKFLRYHLNQQKLDMMVCTCHLNYAGSINRIVVLAGSGIK